MNPVVSCEHCAHVFEADASLAGGYTNCPQCHKATPVEGLRDPLWRAWQIGVLAVVLTAAVVVGMTIGPAVGVAVGVAGFGLAWVISRAF